MRIIMSIFILLLLIGCRSQKEISKTEVSKTDSTHIQEVTITKDTIIGFKGDTLNSIINTEHDTIYIERSGRAQNLVIVKDHKVFIKSTCDSLSAIVTKISHDYKQFIENHKDSIYTTSVDIERTVYQTPRWKNALVIGFFLLLIWTFRKVIAKAAL